MQNRWILKFFWISIRFPFESSNFRWQSSSKFPLKFRLSFFQFRTISKLLFAFLQLPLALPFVWNDFKVNHGMVSRLYLFYPFDRGTKISSRYWWILFDFLLYPWVIIFCVFERQWGKCSSILFISRFTNCDTKHKYAFIFRLRKKIFDEKNFRIKAIYFLTLLSYFRRCALIKEWLEIIW